MPDDAVSDASSGYFARILTARSRIILIFTIQA